MGWTKKQQKDRAQEKQEIAALKTKVVPQTEEDRARLKRESEAFFKQWGEHMRGGRP